MINDKYKSSGAEVIQASEQLTEALKRYTKDTNEEIKALKRSIEETNEELKKLQSLNTLQQKIISHTATDEEVKQKVKQLNEGATKRKQQNRIKFIEAIHRFLNTPELNIDGRVAMYWVVNETKLSPQTCRDIPYEIKSGICPCGYADVKEWANKSSRWRRVKPSKI